MADSSIFRQGESVNLTIPASSQIAVWTQGKALVYQRTGAANVPTGPKVLIATVQAGVPYISGVLSASVATLVIVENAQEAVTNYQIGVSPITMGQLDSVYQPTVGTLNATGALTLALLKTRIITSTTGAAVAATLDTGTVLDAASAFVVGDSLDWTIVNTGGNAFTVTAAAGHTIVGVAAVATVTSATFRTVKTAAATYITYRLAG